MRGKQILQLLEWNENMNFLHHIRTRGVDGCGCINNHIEHEHYILKTLHWFDRIHKKQQLKKSIYCTMEVSDNKYSMNEENGVGLSTQSGEDQRDVNRNTWWRDGGSQFTQAEFLVKVCVSNLSKSAERYQTAADVWDCKYCIFKSDGLFTCILDYLLYFLILKYYVIFLEGAFDFLHE